jgi:lysophospholipase L1-like esterase
VFLSRHGRAIRAAWLMTGLVLVLFVAAEAILSFAFQHKDQSGRRAGEDERIAADCYPDSAWVREMYRELGNEDVAWCSYVYWRRKPFHGEYINVDSAGVRATWHSVHRDATQLPEIFMFGGSTMWGTGVRDAYTIPSCLARELEARGIRARVVNFGETGYVSTQELLALELELRRGHVPALVVFYDGINDTFAAWQSGVTGIPQNESHRAAEFNISNPRRLKERTRALLRDEAQLLATRRTVDSLLRRLRKSGLAQNRSAALDDSLAAQVVNTYLANVDLVRALAAHYHFKCSFYWQPSLFDKPHRTAYEMSQLARARDMEPFFQFVNTAPLSSRGVHDLSNHFAEEAKPVFIDWCHLGESGNTTVARALADDVAASLDASR